MSNWGSFQIRLLLGIGIGWLPALMGYEACNEVTNLYFLSQSSLPYFQGAHALLLYLITPIVVLSSFLIFLSPGILLALGMGKVKSWSETLLLGFGVSLILCICLSIGSTFFFDSRMTPSTMLGVWGIITILCFLILLANLWKNPDWYFVIEKIDDGHRLVFLSLFVLINVMVFAPKLFWEDFNVDGIEAFEFSRSLSTHLLPYWELNPGVFGFYQNFFLFAYPNNWFMVLFGVIEAAVRLPCILYVALTFVVLTLLIEHQQDRKLTFGEDMVLWLSLVTYMVILVYVPTWEPFFSDMAEPSTPDAMMILCFLAACYFLWEKHHAWFIVFACMTYFTAPGGLLLLLALAGAIWLSGNITLWRFRDIFAQRELVLAGGVVCLCLVFGLLYEGIYTNLVLGADGKSQLSGMNMIKRLYPPNFTEVVRFNTLLFPTGILPALVLPFAIRRELRSSIIAIVTLAYFGVLYVQAWAGIHQFMPAMILPTIVFWRLYLGSTHKIQRLLFPSLVLGLVASLWLSLPQHFQLHFGTRILGHATAFNVGNYQSSYNEAIKATWTLSAIFPSDYRLLYPNQPWSVDPYPWIYYSQLPKPPRTKINYIIQYTTDNVPIDATQVGEEDGVAVYVRDLEMWKRHQENQFPQVSISPLYEPILRHSLQFFREYMERVQLEEGSEK